MKKSATYEVTLRRDVQQVTCVRVQASSPQEAIAVAESVSSDADGLCDVWNIEEHLGSHRPKVQLLQNTPIKGRQVGKADRRTATDRRGDKRRLGDKVNERLAARKRT